MGFPAAQPVKALPAMRETWVRSVGWEGPLEKGKVPTPAFWAGESHGLYSAQGHTELDTTERPASRRRFLTRMCVGRKGDHYGMRSDIS